MVPKWVDKLADLVLLAAGFSCIFIGTGNQWLAFGVTFIALFIKD